jgi:hypothetical protein
MLGELHAKGQHAVAKHAGGGRGVQLRSGVLGWHVGAFHIGEIGTC